MDAIIQSTRASGTSSTRAVQNQLHIGENAIVTSDTLTISSDRVGFLVNNLLHGCAPESPPSEEVHVSTGLKDVSITKMMTFEGKFQTVLWLLLSWDDPRLAWNPLFCQGQLQIDPSRIWTPSHFFENVFEQNDVCQAPAIIANDGKAFLEINIQSEFLCGTSDGLQKFPFDKCDCSIDLSLTDRAGGIVLDSNLGFAVIETDQHFLAQTSVDGDSSVSQEEAAGEEKIPNPDGKSQSPDHEDSPVTHCRIRFERRHCAAHVRLILPSVLINAVGFVAFWTDGKQESIALGIASLLCCLTFRQTVEMPDASDAIWTEIFVMLNIMAQAYVMFITWASCGSARSAVAMTGCCKNMDPRRICKNVLKRSRWKGGGVEKPIAPETSIESSFDRGTETTRQQRGGMSSCRLTDPESASDGYHEDQDEEKRKIKTDEHPSVDWMGRCFVAPGYIVILLIMIYRGVGIL